MVRIRTSKKKTVSRVPDSNSEDGSLEQKTAGAGKTTLKSGDEDLTAVSVHEKVALLAYSYWEERGRPAGSPEEDWYRAEKEVMSCASHENV